MTDRFYYGGQALIEGVMMRGRKIMVTAVRRPDGELVIDSQPLPSIYSGGLRRTPLIRGVIVLVEALVLGIKTLLHSANVSLGEEDEEVPGVLLGVMVVTALALAIAMFFIAPLFLTRLLRISSPLLFNLVDGLMRVAIFLAYLKLMTLLPDIKRVFAYHGAEHKVVNAYEAGVPLAVEVISRYSTAHVRCGTGFLFVVLVISIIVFAFAGLPSLWLMVLWRITLLPLIAALSYEIIYWAGRHSENVLVRVVLAPGLWLQSLTTREPDVRQLEVALAALKGVMEAEQLDESPLSS